MLGTSHYNVTERAFRLLYTLGTRTLHKLKETVAEEAKIVDHYRDLELVDVESLQVSGGRDDPHVKRFLDDDDIPRYESYGQIYTAFNHYIDIKKGPGLFDDFDGYSYRRGSASKDEYQDASDAKKDWKIALISKLTGNEKVDKGLNYWLNDEYVHAPGHKWYRGCSPSVAIYSFFSDRGNYQDIETEAEKRFPLAESTGKRGKGIPYSVFMPVDNMAKYWYNIFINTQYPKALGPVMHAIQDASIPHHAAGYNGNWHARYEKDLDVNLNNWLRNSKFVNEIKELYSEWSQNKEVLPNTLKQTDYQKMPSRNSRSDTLVTWVALNAYKEYADTYHHFRNGYQLNENSMKNLVKIATAMSMLVLDKAIYETGAKLMLIFADSDARDKFWGMRVLLKPKSFPTQLIRHKNFIGEVTEIATSQDREDATFRIAPGLVAEAKKGMGISFASTNYPGYYLRHEHYRIKLAEFDNSQLFREDATFKMVPGCTADHFSFESHNYPLHFIRQKDSHLYIDNKPSDNREDISFLILLEPSTQIL